jgi:hypothetical protein
MKCKITKETEYDVRFMVVDTCVRYWEDTDVDGVEDDAVNPRIPCAQRIDEFEVHWQPVIEVETGRIINWAKGVRAEVTYKVCDEFRCKLKTEMDKPSVYRYVGYVPKIMYPRENGYGDYIEMNIDTEGYIEGWNAKMLQQLIDYMENYAEYDTINKTCRKNML